jgi:hypothetical protein
LAWAHKNPDKVKHQQLLNETKPDRRFNAFAANVRSKYGDLSLLNMDDKESLILKMQDPCAYCDHLPGPGGKLNGLDRIVHGGMYDDENTVSCCGVCNAMKGFFNLDEFIEGVRKISTRNNLMISEDSIRALVPFGGTKERREGVKADKSDHLTTDQRITLLAGPCYLCGQTPAFGIDRVDAKQSYTQDNCKSCCSLCNYMKKDHRLGDFLVHVSSIDKMTRYWVLKDTKPHLTGPCGPRKPIAYCMPSSSSTQPLLIFPGIRAVEGFLGKTPTPRAGADSQWKLVSIENYKDQIISSDCAAEIMRMLRNDSG